MGNYLTRLSGAAIAIVCLSLADLAVAGPVQRPDPTRSLAVADLTALEAFGRAAISPDGRWAVYEKRGAYDTIPRFEYEWRSAWSIMDLWLVDLRDPWAAPALLLPGEGPGLQRLTWSPSGDRLLITRVRDGRLEPGVVTLADRTVQWTGLTLDVPRTGAQAAWLTDDRLVAVVRPDHSLPASMAYQGATPARMGEAWERTALGREPSRTIVEARDGIATTPVDAAMRALVLVDLVEGPARTLSAGFINDFSVSPDGRRIAVVESAEAAPIRRDEVVQFESPARQRLSLIDLADDTVTRPMSDRDIAPGLLRWSPASDAVLVWARPDASAWRDGDLMQVGPTGRVVSNMPGLTIGSSVDAVLGVHADWLGRRPVLYARPDAGTRFDWYVLAPAAEPRNLTSALATPPTRLAAVEGSARLFADGGYWEMTATGLRRVTASETPLRDFTVGDFELVNRLKLNEAPRRNWSVAHGADGETVVIRDRTPRRLGPGAGPTGRVLAVSTDAELFLHRSGLSESLQLRTAQGEYRVDGVNQTLTDVRWIEPIPIIHPDLHGAETRSYLYLPSADVPIRGLVVKVYPGFVDTGEWLDPLSLTYALQPQVFAAAGFAVLSASMPELSAPQARGDELVRSVDLAVDAALTAVPQLPEDRMAVLGHSFGGYAALEIAARSHRFRSYIASAAFTDMFGVWGEFEPSTRILQEDGGMIRPTQGWVETGQGNLAVPPWADIAVYAASSPYLLADRITAPVLLVTADMDFVPMSQSERMYSALLRTGGRVKLVTYWGEHHILWSPANIQDRFVQMFDWLDTTLAKPDLRTSDRAGVPTP